MSAASQDRGLRADNGDFRPRWHLICLAAVAGALMLAYMVAKKLIFG